MPWIIGIGLAIVGFFVTKVMQPRAGTPTIWVIGDSQACWCSGLTTDKNPSRAFLKGTTPVGQAECKIGSRTADWNAEIKNVPFAPGDWVLLFLGSNEMTSTPDPTPIAKHVLGRGGRLVWVGPPTIRGARGAFPESVRAKLQPLGVPYFDSRTLKLEQSDGVHPTPDEAVRWMQAVLASIQGGTP
jgi:lysophospholipase L1-like esterase